MNPIVEAQKVTEQAHVLRGLYLREALADLWRTVRHRAA